MMVMVLLIGVSLLVASGFLYAFIMSVRSGQYDDTHTPAVRMLFDNELRTEKKNETQKTATKTET
jgi:cbb3-type cytochrome oxidase maturation protein